MTLTKQQARAGVAVLLAAHRLAAHVSDELATTPRTARCGSPWRSRYTRR